MCKFCDVDEYDIYTGMHRLVKKEYHFGKYSDLLISLYLDGRKENGAELWLTGNIDNGDAAFTLFDTFININYCPMCGKYIGKEGDQNAG